MPRRCLWIGLVIMVCALVWSACGDKQAGPRRRVAGGAPDFTLRMLNGSTVRLSKLVGKPVVVHFWGSW